MMSVLCKLKHRRKRLRYERCVICGVITDTPIQKPIFEREGYISGCGQTCRKCYLKLCK